MTMPEISVGELSTRLASGGVPLFDVRNPDEFVAGHVPGALLIPLSEVPGRVGEFPAAGSVFVICKSGGRSGQAVEFLRERGIDAVNIAGGTMAWANEGRPLETGGA